MTTRDERIVALADSDYIRHLVDAAPEPTDHPKGSTMTTGRLTPELARTLAGLRYLLCDAVLLSEDARPDRERREHFAQANAYARAIDIILAAHGLTGPITPYTTPWLDGCGRLQPDDERIAREWLADADRILGEAPRSTSTHTDTTAGTARGRRPAGGG